MVITLWADSYMIIMVHESRDFKKLLENNIASSIYIGLHFAQEQWFNILHVQSDCVEAMSLLRDPRATVSKIPLVRAIFNSTTKLGN
ncbi:hypothetical protein V6N11_060357 [Hibiscus sabdariffa]|uniref:RNase H type-1 domain-containing protein n=1 Tax=Hibiscus sabdariffa TaxID=183260 RepID=A0ABR2QQ29_9ROSI